MFSLRSGAAIMAVALAASLSTDSAGRSPKSGPAQPKPSRSFLAEPLPPAVLAGLLRAADEVAIVSIGAATAEPWLASHESFLAPLESEGALAAPRLHLGRRDTAVLLDLTTETGPWRRSVERPGALLLTIDPLGRQPMASAFVP